MRSSINRLITLGVLLLAFSALALADEEWTCATAADCIHGQSCRAGECFCVTYWKKVEGTKGPCNVPDPPVCDEKSCLYNASCSVIDNEVDCECLEGAKGDKCDSIIVDHCKVNGIKDSACKNEGVCTNLLKDYSCACNSHWAGKTCAEYSFFSVSPEKQVVFEEDFVRLSVNLLKDKPAWHSVLLLFYVENSAGTKKVTVTGNPANDELTLHVEGSDAVTKSAPGLFTVGVWRSIEATFDGTDLVIRDNAAETHRVALPAGSKGTKVVFGGCSWESSGGNCGAKDDIYYNAFIGGVQSFTLDGSAKGYTSGAGGHQDLFTCTDITCSVHGSSGCNNSSVPHCVCKDGYGGATCADSMQASFNGYTSKINLTHHYMGGHPTDNGGNAMLNKPVYISFNASVPVTEEIAYLAVFTGPGFEFKIVARLEDSDSPTISPDIITDKEGPYSCFTMPWGLFNDAGKFVIEVTVNGNPWYCYGSWTPDTIHSDLSITLGYSDIVHQDNLQGCISNLVIDGQQVGFNNTAAIGTMVDYSQCVNNILPDDPCDDERCNERGKCAIDMINYSAKCECFAGFNGTMCENDLSRCVIEIPCGAAEKGTCKDIADAPYYECTCKKEDGYKFNTTEGLEGTCVFDKCHFCALEIGEGHASACVADTGECTCVEGWKGEHCAAEAATVKSSTQTTLIIVVVALLVLMVVLISVIFTVRRCNRKNQGEGTYSPNKAELEMGATPPPKGDNIYKNSEVIENVNAESKLFEQPDANSLHDTSYNIYNITADDENGAKEEVVYDIADAPSPPPPADEPAPPPPAPVVEEEIALPPPPMDEPPIVYETVSTPPPPANDLPEPPTPLNTTAAESPNVTMDNNVTMETGNAGVEDVKVDVGGDIEQCEDSNRLSTI